MDCLVISQEQKKEFHNLKSITLPGASGELQLLPGHAEIFIVLGPGEVVLENKEKTTLFVEGGLAYFKNDLLRVIL